MKFCILVSLRVLRSYEVRCFGCRQVPDGVRCNKIPSHVVRGRVRARLGSSCPASERFSWRSASLTHWAHPPSPSRKEGMPSTRGDSSLGLCVRREDIFSFKFILRTCLSHPFHYLMAAFDWQWWKEHIHSLWMCCPVKQPLIWAPFPSLDTCATLTKLLSELLCLFYKTRLWAPGNFGAWKQGAQAVNCSVAVALHEAWTCWFACNLFCYI